MKTAPHTSRGLTGLTKETYFFPKKRHMLLSSKVTGSCNTRQGAQEYDLSTGTGPRPPVFVLPTPPLASPKPRPLTPLLALSSLRVWALLLGVHCPHIHQSLDSFSFLHPPPPLGDWSFIWTSHTHLRAHLEPQAEISLPKSHLRT